MIEITFQKNVYIYIYITNKKLELTRLDDAEDKQRAWIPTTSDSRKRNSVFGRTNEMREAVQGLCDKNPRRLGNFMKQHAVGINYITCLLLILKIDTCVTSSVLTK